MLGKRFTPLDFSCFVFDLEDRANNAANLSPDLFLLLPSLVSGWRLTLGNKVFHFESSEQTMTSIDTWLGRL